MVIIYKVTNKYFVEDLNNPSFTYMLQAWFVEILQKDKESLQSFREEFEQNEQDSSDDMKKMSF